VLNKKIGCAVLVLLIAASGLYVNLRPARLPDAAKQNIDDFIQRFQGPGFSYRIVSAQKAARQASMDNVDNLEAALGVGSWPAGICPPSAPQLTENWCVILDKEIATSSRDRFTHLIAQRQGQLWIVDGVPDSDQGVFRVFGCKW
jgi:hypothetical protein